MRTPMRKHRNFRICEKRMRDEKERKLLSVTCPKCGSSIATTQWVDDGDTGYEGYGDAVYAYLRDEISLMQCIAMCWSAHWRHEHTDYDDSYEDVAEESRQNWGYVDRFDIEEHRESAKEKYAPHGHPIIPEELIDMETIARREKIWEFSPPKQISEEGFFGIVKKAMWKEISEIKKEKRKERKRINREKNKTDARKKLMAVLRSYRDGTYLARQGQAPNIPRRNQKIQKTFRFLSFQAKMTPMLTGDEIEFFI